MLNKNKPFFSNKENNVKIGPVPQASLQNVKWSPFGHSLVIIFFMKFNTLIVCLGICV